MVSVVNDSCIKCKTCAGVCPVDAFHEAESQLVVDPEVCISDCPVSAISPEDEADEATVKFNAEQAKVCPNAND